MICSFCLLYCKNLCKAILFTIIYLLWNISINSVLYISACFSLLPRYSSHLLSKDNVLLYHTLILLFKILVTDLVGHLSQCISNFGLLMAILAPWTTLSLDTRLLQQPWLHQTSHHKGSIFWRKNLIFCQWTRITLQSRHPSIPS